MIRRSFMIWRLGRAGQAAPAAALQASALRMNSTAPAMRPAVAGVWRAPTAAPSLSAMLLALAAGGATVSGCAAAKVKEPSTGAEFFTTMDGVPLMGCGCRYKYGFAKIYAVAVYFDPVVLRATSDDPAMWREMVDCDCTKSISIKMSRNLEAKQLTDALDQAFIPRLSTPGRSDAGVEEFKEACTVVCGGKCEEGDEIIWSFFPGQGLRVSALKKNGEVLHEPIMLNDADVSWALFDTYLGGYQTAVSPSLRESIKSSFK